MLFLRSLVYIIGASIALIVVLLELMLFFLPLSVRYKIACWWARFCVWWLKITCNIDINIIGLENIPSHPCVIASNHQSTLDVLFFQTFLPHQTWVIKKQLLYIPIFGWGLALLRPIIIDRKDKLNAIRKITSQGVKSINANIWVTIYPEGTRQPYGKLAKYQSGAVSIAKKSHTDILPIYHNAGQFWAKGQFIKKPGTINITIGKPINPDGRNSKEVMREIENWALHLQEKYLQQ